MRCREMVVHDVSCVYRPVPLRRHGNDQNLVRGLAGGHYEEPQAIRSPGSEEDVMSVKYAG